MKIDATASVSVVVGVAGDSAANPIVVDGDDAVAQVHNNRRAAHGNGVVYLPSINNRSMNALIHLRGSTLRRLAGPRGAQGSPRPASTLSRSEGIHGDPTTPPELCGYLPNYRGKTDKKGLVRLTSTLDQAGQNGHPTPATPAR